jgi:hypothetical protein
MSEPNAMPVQVAIAAAWKPHTALPKVEHPISIVVAFPPRGDEPEDVYCLGSDLFIVYPDGRVVSEDDDSLLSPQAVFWWVEEDALLLSLDPVRRADLQRKGGRATLGGG